MEHTVEEDTEEVILSWWGRKKAWWEIGGTVVKIIQIGMLIFKWLFLGTTAAVVVGQATDTKPLLNAAVEVGMTPAPSRDILSNDAIYEELSNLIEDVERLEALLGEHQHNYPESEVIVGPAGPPGKDGKSVTGPQGPPGKDGRSPAVAPAEPISTVAITDALNRHILDEH